MSKETSKVWHQLFAVNMLMPSLRGMLPRWIVFTVFVTNQEDYLQGHCRVFTISSAQQVFQMLAENKECILLPGFLVSIAEAVKSGTLYQDNFDGIEPLRMSEDTDMAVIAAGSISDRMITVNQMRAAQEDVKNDLANMAMRTSWGKGGKPQA